MKLYFPSFDTKWSIKTIESNSLHFLWHSYNGGYSVYDCKRIINGRMYHSGTLMYSDRLYTDERGAQAYINKDYNTARKYLFFKNEECD